MIDINYTAQFQDTDDNMESMIAGFRNIADKVMKGVTF